MKGEDKTKQYIETLSKKDKQRLLDAAETVEGFQGGCIFILILGIALSILYGAYWVGYQEGRHEGIREVVKYNQCAYKTTSLGGVDDCWDKEVTDYAS